MAASRLVCVFCVFLAALASQVIGLEISVGVALPDSKDCVLREVIDVTLSRSDLPDWSLRLERDDVTSSGSDRRVHILQAGEVIQYSLESDSEIRERSSYHNHREGASLLVTCVVTSRGVVPRLQGSVYQRNKKYRVEPSDQWLATLTFTTTHVVAKYSFEPLQEVLHMHDYIKVPDHYKPPPPPPGREDQPLPAFSPLTREKRQTAQTYFLDVLPVVDYALYLRWLARTSGNETEAVRAISEYLEDVFTSVSMRVRTIALSGGDSLQVYMLDPIIATTAEDSEFSESLRNVSSDGSVTVDAVSLLSNFSAWVEGLNTSVLPEHDHAMLLTGIVLTGSNDQGSRFNVTKGLAFTETICERGKSTSIIDDFGAYQSEGPAAHELGHSLGSKHDGVDNQCLSSDRYVMSDGTYEHTDSNRLNPWKFSTCSSEAINAHLQTVLNDTSLKQCLTEKIGEEVTTTLAKLPDGQCQGYLGNDSFTCRGLGLPSLEQICDSFLCRIPGTTLCSQITAATGTCCGNGKMCIEGSCSDVREAGQCVMNETCPLGDQPGVVVDGYTCADIPSTYCYQEDIREKCCLSCPKKETQLAGCTYGDKQVGCVESNCLNTLTTGIAYSFICCETCKDVNVEGCVDARQIDYNGYNYNCSEFLDRFGNSWCSNKNLHTTACCQTCEERRNTLNNVSCPYGDQVHLYNCKRLLALSRDCNEDEKNLCCETCPQKEAGVTPEPTPAPSTPERLSAAPPTAAPTADPQATPSATTQAVEECDNSGRAPWSPCSASEVKVKDVLLLLSFCFFLVLM